MWGTQANFNPKKRLTLYNQVDKRWGKVASRQTKRHLSENWEERRNEYLSNKGFGNYPYYGTSTKFMQMNGKPRQLPWLGEKVSKKAKRASSNVKENLTQNQIFIKQEKRNKIINTAFGKKKREIAEYEDKFKANHRGKYSICFSVINYCLNRSKDKNWGERTSSWHKRSQYKP